MSAVNLAGLKRIDEHKLQELQDRAARNDPELTEVDLLWLSVLQDRYALFLEEGMRALRASQPIRAGGNNNSSGDFGSASCNNNNGSMAGSSPPLSSPSSGGAAGLMNSFLGKVNRLRGQSISSPLAGGAGGGPLQQETAKLCKHWTWVADYLVLGAIPLADNSTTDPSGHLLGLKEQCRERNTKVSLVVSALEFDEAASPQLRPFAGPREWEETMGTDAFVHICLPKDLEAPVTTPHSEVLAACAQIHDAIVHHGRCVYMHCKAGLSRCWVLAMCYLTAHRNMTVAEADGLLTLLRPQLKPTVSQREYVERFVEFVGAQRAPIRSKAEDEALYFRILADLLSLPAAYRQRLVRDIEQLT